MQLSVTGRAHARVLLVSLAVGLAALLSACASTGSGSGSSSSRNVITSEQLQEHSTLNALEAIQRLKPTWLRTRGPETSRQFPMAVVVDGVVQGGVEVLRGYRATSLDEIRYLDARQGKLRFGDRAAGGAILLTTAGRAGN